MKIKVLFIILLTGIFFEGKAQDEHEAIYANLGDGENEEWLRSRRTGNDIYPLRSDFHADGANSSLEPSSALNNGTFFNVIVDNGSTASPGQLRLVRTNNGRFSLGMNSNNNFYIGRTAQGEPANNIRLVLTPDGFLGLGMSTSPQEFLHLSGPSRNIRIHNTQNTEAGLIFTAPPSSGLIGRFTYNSSNGYFSLFNEEPTTTAPFNLEIGKNNAPFRTVIYASSNGVGYFGGSTLFPALALLGTNDNAGVSLSMGVHSKVPWIGTSQTRSTVPTGDAEERLRFTSITIVQPYTNYHRLFEVNGSNNVNYFRINRDQTVINNLVGINTTTIPQGYQLAVDGKIICTELKVQHYPWPDYVFEDAYRLAPLEEVEMFIKENKHLPEVPSADEVEKDGINVGEMDALLLRKVEELTLYLIQQQRSLQAQQAELDLLKEQNELLMKLLLEKGE